jgi:hypothetical protein
MHSVSASKSRTGKALRFLASRGWADEDPDVLADLVRQAHALANMILAEREVSAELRAAATALIVQLEDDTFSEL